MKTRLWNVARSAYDYRTETESTLEPATGVCDSLGREIYAGDILQQNMSLELEKSRRAPNIGFVYYDRGSFFIDGGGPLWDYLVGENNQIDDYQIIGNCRENPELKNQ